MNFESYVGSQSNRLSPLKVLSWVLSVDQKQMTVILVDDEFAALVCRNCGRVSRRRGHLPIRRVRDHDFEGIKVFLSFAFPRVECDVHGVGMAHQSFFEPHSAFTIEFEDAALDLVTDRISASAVARRLKISRAALKRILDHACRRRRASM